MHDFRILDIFLCRNYLRALFFLLLCVLAHIPIFLRVLTNEINTI
jgi:hypothetical protein